MAVFKIKRKISGDLGLSDPSAHKSYGMEMG